MRVIYSTTNPQEANIIAALLKADGIDCNLEVSKVSDWGSNEYGDVKASIWIIDEDRVDEALRLLDHYRENPQVVPPVQKAPPQGYKKPVPFNAMPQGLTLFFLGLCSLLYAITATTSPNVAAVPSYMPATPFVSSATKKALIYDYPEAFEIVDKLEATYTIDQLSVPKELPKEGQLLVKKFLDTPYWQGVYQMALDSIKDVKSKTAPLFEKIGQGEVWRLFSPALLHADILHLLFNMLWLAVLGKQIEIHIGKFKYLVFIFIAGVITNTLQYLVGGVNFLGFSGIVCAMLTFICMRQWIAPWEGYPLERPTAIFLLVFIGAMGMIQAISFTLEATRNLSISPGIANTAHLSGAALGLLLGRIPYFSWRG